MILNIRIDEKPRAMPRPRFTKSGIAYYPAEIKYHKKDVSTIIKNAIHKQQWKQPDKKTPLFVQMDFIHPRVKRLRTKERTYKTTKPDIDNIVKMYMDCCTTAQVWNDDNQVCKLIVNDYYAAIDEKEHVIIIVEELDHAKKKTRTDTQQKKTVDNACEELSSVSCSFMGSSLP